MELELLFDLSGKVAVITGGAGLLGTKHAEALLEVGAYCVLVDVLEDKVRDVAKRLSSMNPSYKVLGLQVDITRSQEIQRMLDRVIREFGKVDILINNAANNPHYESMQSGNELSRFEFFPLEAWHLDLAVGLTGAFLCSQIIGSYMAQNRSGVILNISSDLALIAPDQRIYRKEGVSEDNQPTKPVSYSVVKSGLLGLTRYVATYWADKGVRCNALVPGGVYNDQDSNFVDKLTNLIPLRRMAKLDEYKASIVFLCSDASSYMTGASLVIDGGRTAW